MSSETVDSLELHSGDYVTRYNTKSLARVEALADRMSLRRDDTIADFACGGGVLLQVLGDRTGEYCGIDFSPDFISSAEQIARQKDLRNYSFHCMDIVDFCNLHPGEFSIATALDFSEHIDDETFVRIFAAIRTCMRANGRLFLHTPNLEFFLERFKDIGIMKQFPEHIAVRDRQSLESLLQEAGFKKENIKTSTIAHYNVLKYFHPMSKLPVIGRAFAARLWFEVSL